jgi:hypothetical protein
MKWLDKIPLSVIFFIALFLALAPFMPEPHLWQKLKMLVGGTLVKPIDIFDLVWHGAPLVILVLKLIRLSSLKKSQ